METTHQKPMQAHLSARWHVHWGRPTLMIVLYLVYVATGVGHHFYYLHFDTLRVENCQNLIEGGIALSVLAQLCLAASLWIAYTQRMWMTLRRKTLQLQSVDALFALPTNPARLLDYEIILHAKVAVLLAVLVWLTVLLPILVPGTLGTEWKQDSAYLVYKFDWSTLLVVYGAALFLGLIGVLIGMHSFKQNHLSVGAGFLTTLCTTRNSTMDQLARGTCFGADPIAHDLRTARVRFGELPSGAVGINRGHAAFGLPGEVRDLRRDMAYE